MEHKSEVRLRVVSLSLSPSCVTRKKTVEKKATWNPCRFSFFFNLVEENSFTVRKKFLSVAKMASTVYERDWCASPTHLFDRTTDGNPGTGYWLTRTQTKPLVFVDFQFPQINCTCRARVLERKLCMHRAREETSVEWQLAVATLSTLLLSSYLTECLVLRNYTFPLTCIEVPCLMKMQKMVWQSISWKLFLHYSKI